MKLLYCLAGTFNAGGMERIVIDKANWLAQHGYEVTIVTTEQKGRPDFFKLHKDVKRKDLDIMYSESNGFNPLRKYIARRRGLSEHKKRLQQVVEEICPDIIISTFGNEIGIVPQLKTNSKRIAEIHFSRWYRLQMNRTGIWRLIDKFLTYTDKKYLKGYDKFVILTDEDRKNWKSDMNIEVIPNFIRSRAKTPALLENKVAIAVGRFSYQKGYDRLVKAWKIVAEKYPDWKLEIYGGGEDRKSIESLIIETGLESKILTHDPIGDIEKIYQQSSIFVLSSRYEGLPMVLLEAMANGLPPVAFSCQCGPKDVITNGENGLLIDEGNIEALANGIITLIKNPEYRKKMGINAYGCSSNYQIENIMPVWKSLYYKLT